MKNWQDDGKKFKIIQNYRRSGQQNQDAKHRDLTTKLLLINNTEAKQNFATHSGLSVEI